MCRCVFYIIVHSPATVINVSAVTAGNERQYFAFCIAACRFNFLFYMLANAENVTCKGGYVLENYGIYLLEDKFVVRAVLVSPGDSICIVYMTVFQCRKAGGVSVYIKMAANFVYTFFCHFIKTFRNMLLFIICCAEHFDFALITVKIIRCFKNKR